MYYLVASLGSTALQKELTALVDLAAPSAPTNLQVSNDRDKTATLSWSAPATNEDGSRLTDLAGYILAYRDITADQKWQEVDVGNVRTEAVENLVNDHVYQFKIKAYNHSGQINYSSWTPIVSIQLKDRIKPKIFHSPINRWEAAVEMDPCVEITDNEKVKAGRLFYKNANNKNWRFVPIIAGKGCDRGIIPSSEVQLGELHYYYEAEDNSGNIARLPANAPDQNYTVEIFDLTPPKIIHKVIKAAYYGEDFKVSARITDNVEVKSAKLYYRGWYSHDWRAYEMTKKDGVHSAVVPKEKIDLWGVQYYIEAVDSSGNKRTEPPGAPMRYRVLPVIIRDKPSPLFDATLPEEYLFAPPMI